MLRTLLGVGLEALGIGPDREPLGAVANDALRVAFLDRAADFFGQAGIQLITIRKAQLALRVQVVA